MIWINKPRLIDANELNDALIDLFQEIDDMYIAGRVISLVNLQPTAYNVEGVVEQLEENAELTHLNRMEERVGKKQTVGFALGIREAIEIVKGNGNENSL